MVSCLPQDVFKQTKFQGEKAHVLLLHENLKILITRIFALLLLSLFRAILNKILCFRTHNTQNTVVMFVPMVTVSSKKLHWYNNRSIKPPYCQINPIFFTKATTVFKTQSKICESHCCMVCLFNLMGKVEDCFPS